MEPTLPPMKIAIKASIEVAYFTSLVKLSLDMKASSVFNFNQNYLL